MKSICALALALGAATGLAPAAFAADGVHVTAVVETPGGVFFQPSQFPAVVWFFPKTELSVAISPPPQPAGTFWRAAVVFKSITADDLALLPPEWNGKSFVPFIIRPTSECTLTTLPEMRFAFQEVRALNRDVSSANPPVCRFTFRLPTVMSPDLEARFAALVSADTLIRRVLNIDLVVEASIAWLAVHPAVVAVLAEPPAAARVVASGLTLEQAQAAVASALASPALGAVNAAVTPAERQAFIDAAVAALFVPATTGGTSLQLVASPPAGSILYHVDPFHRAM